MCISSLNLYWLFLMGIYKSLISNGNKGHFNTNINPYDFIANISLFKVDLYILITINYYHILPEGLFAHHLLAVLAQIKKKSTNIKSVC